MRLGLRAAIITTTIVAACGHVSPTDPTVKPGTAKHDGVFLGAGGYSVTPPETAPSNSTADTTTKGGVFIGAGGY
jgi:hypothetical protein